MLNSTLSLTLMLLLNSMKEKLMEDNSRLISPPKDPTLPQKAPKKHREDPNNNKEKESPLKMPLNPKDN